MDDPDPWDRSNAGVPGVRAGVAVADKESGAWLDVLLAPFQSDDFSLVCSLRRVDLFDEVALLMFTEWTELCCRSPSVIFLFW